MLTSTLVAISCVAAAQEIASPPASPDALRESVPEAVESSSAPNPVGDLSIIPLSFDLQHDGRGIFSSVVPLGCSVVLDGVTEVIIDALRVQFTTFLPASFSVSAELLSNGTTIAGPGIAISGGVRGGDIDVDGFVDAADVAVLLGDCST